MEEMFLVNETSICERISDECLQNATETPVFAENIPEMDTFGEVMKAINIYFTPILVFGGIITNMLSFCVFVMTHLRTQSSSVYLAALAVSDSGFLFALFLSWFSWIKVHLVHRPVWCQLTIYLTYVCSFVSVFSVVAFTCERFIAVQYPLHRKRWCTRRAAIFAEVGISIFALLFYSFCLWSTSIIVLPGGEKHCVPKLKYLDVINIMNNCDSVMTLIIPSFIIVVLNVRIGYTVYKVMNRRREMCPLDARRSRKIQRDKNESSTNRQAQNRTDDNISENHRSSMFLSHSSSDNSSRPNYTQIRTTRMLLLVSSVFLLLNLPSHAFRLHGLVLQLLHRKNQISLKMSRLQELCQIIYYCNFATNFILYSFSARRFREALRRLLLRAYIRLSNVNFRWLLRHNGHDSNPVDVDPATVRNQLITELKTFP